MKISRTGWVGKSRKLAIIKKDYNDELEILEVWNNRGLKKEWDTWDWPPRKVKIIMKDMK